MSWAKADQRKVVDLPRWWVRASNSIQLGSGVSYQHISFSYISDLPSDVV